MNLDELRGKIGDIVWSMSKDGPEAIDTAIDELFAELAKQEPVAETVTNDGCAYVYKAHQTLPVPTLLYAAPVIPAGWVMVPEDVIDQINTWAKAYPEDIFPEVSPQEWTIVRSALTGVHVYNGDHISLDRISASNMRHVITKVKAMLSAAPKGE